MREKKEKRNNKQNRKVFIHHQLCAHQTLEKGGCFFSLDINKLRNYSILIGEGAISKKFIMQIILQMMQNDVAFFLGEVFK